MCVPVELRAQVQRVKINLGCQPSPPSATMNDTVCFHLLVCSQAILASSSTRNTDFCNHNQFYTVMGSSV